MPDVAGELAITEADCTDLTRMEGPGIELETDAGGRRAVESAAGPALRGRRLMFRALLRQERASDGSCLIDVIAPVLGRLGCLPKGVAERYAAVAAELSRHGRQGVCSGYLLAGEGLVAARLLLHEPDECLRRLEIDLLERRPSGLVQRVAVSR